MVTQKRLKELFTYDPEAGLFKWRVNKPPKGKVGAFAGRNMVIGYVQISVDGRSYLAHRMAFLYMTDSIPTEVDHLNHCRHDNRWINLRAADRHSNCANVAGRLGVRRRYGRWYARYGRQHLGAFDTQEKAIAARRAAEITAAGMDPNAQAAPPKNAIKTIPSRRFSYKGKNLSEWSRETGIPQPTLHYRIFVAGMTPAKALTARRD